MKNLTLWGLTILILLVTGVACFIFCPNNISAYGSVFGAAAGFVAVIWFYSSLQQQNESIKLQTKQLDEQRQQFQAEFKILRQESKRSAILTAKEILIDAEEQIEKDLRDICSFNDFASQFVILLAQPMQTLFTNNDCDKVIEAYGNFGKILLPAKRYLTGIKDAGFILLESEGILNVKTDIEPEWFIVINEDNLKKQVLISKNWSIISMLAHQLTILNIELTGLALSAAMLIKDSKMMKKAESIKLFLKYKDDLPVIVQNYLKTVSSEDLEKIKREIEEENSREQKDATV